MLLEMKETQELMDKIKENLPRILAYIKLYTIDNDSNNKRNNVDLINEMLKIEGFFEIGDDLGEINSEDAFKLGNYLISHDLAYGTEYIKKERAGNIYNLFIENVGKKGIFFTNINSDTMDLNKSYGVKPFSYTTFNVCVIYIGDNKCGIIYQEDED